MLFRSCQIRGFHFSMHAVFPLCKISMLDIAAVWDFSLTCKLTCVVVSCEAISFAGSATGTPSDLKLDQILKGIAIHRFSLKSSTNTSYKALSGQPQRQSSFALLSAAVLLVSSTSEHHDILFMLAETFSGSKIGRAHV